MRKLINVEVDGIDTRDYPDFVDAYISYAEYSNGQPLTEAELAAIPQSEVYEYVIARIY